MEIDEECSDLDHITQPTAWRRLLCNFHVRLESGNYFTNVTIRVSLYPTWGSRCPHRLKLHPVCSGTRRWLVHDVFNWNTVDLWTTPTTGTGCSNHWRVGLCKRHPQLERSLWLNEQHLPPEADRSSWHWTSLQDEYCQVGRASL